jgi:hypothetical protein
MAVIRPPLDLERPEPHGGPESLVAGDASPTQVASEPSISTSIPQSAHDAITVPVAAAPAVPSAARDERSAPIEAASGAPADELDTGWDLGDEDPTAGSDKPEPPAITTPSSGEMAGDGAVDGDGIDTGWD